MLVSIAVNLFCKDHNKQFEFYQQLCGAPEMLEHASPIYRGLQLSGITLGFHAQDAYALLGAEALRFESPSAGHYPTFNLASNVDLDAWLARALNLGALVLKPPYMTYYNAYQVVLTDPEGNLFRLNCYQSL